MYESVFVLGYFAKEEILMFTVLCLAYEQAQQQMEYSQSVNLKFTIAHSLNKPRCNAGPHSLSSLSQACIFTWTATFFGQLNVSSHEIQLRSLFRL